MDADLELIKAIEDHRDKMNEAIAAARKAGLHIVLDETADGDEVEAVYFDISRKYE